MIIPIELKFKADKGSKSAFRTEKTIKSHDVNSVEFHISIDGLELADNHTAKILSIFHTSKSQANVNCEIVEGKIIYKPDTNLISRHEHVTNYVYVYNGNQSLDVREFIYVVDLSKIDETSLEVKEVYDQSYADLLADFEQALSDYKNNLPQADSVRAEIDVILNQFEVDSQAKLSQYDADAQQAITDNQTAFDLAESGRQGNYEQAETDRNQLSAQAVADWEQGADSLLETVESNESARVDAEATRKAAETDRMSSESTRKTNETTRISNENARKSAEEQRKIDHANRSEELDAKANKKQEDWITVPLFNGAQHGMSPLQVMKDEMGFVHFKGSLTNLTTGSKVFGLPVGYRPDISAIEGYIRAPVALNTGREAYFVQINYVGDGYIFNPSNATISFFDNISYLAKRG